ncbi:MAG: hypothetical protein BJ554DRAFT_5886 [Olpidium bornovanus]|uniref:Sm domain-containing protein n=1 Tax=Olpidium bornovanus TaxID=278681 RepID=A0A8H8DKP5_9FUNG|nr:MAG: hypothetical protein BJ554DRAFT_5886 [Olpidium bornovanus]
MNVQLRDITVTARDGRVSQLEQVYIRGSHVRYFIVPDMLRNAPMFKKVGPNALKGKGVGMGRGKATVARAQGKGKSVAGAVALFCAKRGRSCVRFVRFAPYLVFSVFFNAYLPARGRGRGGPPRGGFRGGGRGGR